MADEKEVKEVVEDNNKSKKNKKKGGVFSRIWNSLFRLRSDDFEKRLQHISKEEATLLSRIKRRSLRWRTTARNLIIFSLLLEVNYYINCSGFFTISHSIVLTDMY